MARPGPRTIYRYSREFKATAVRLSQIPGVAVGDVAVNGVTLANFRCRFAFAAMRGPLDCYVH